MFDAGAGLIPPNGVPRFRHRACRKDFSITSGTLLASHKLPLRGYLTAIANFVNEVKGKSASAHTRDQGASCKCAFMFCHNLREAMAVEMRRRVVGGDGKTVEFDGGCIKAASRVDRRFSHNQNGKRECVVIVRERGGKQHLNRYLPEFDFRYNNRVKLGVGDVERAGPVLRGICGKGLTYGSAHSQPIRVS